MDKNDYKPRNFCEYFRAMKQIICISLASALICALSAGCGTAGADGFSLKETPQTYVLQDGDDFITMPTVTLYKNGNAKLSQPPISSLGLFDMGAYTVVGNEMTVSHGKNASVTFDISDGGDTLTISSARLPFTKIGAIYKFRANEEYLNDSPKSYGKQLTVKALRELAEKAPNLTEADFEEYEHYDIDPDYHVFEVGGDYTLQVVLSVDGYTHCTVIRRTSGEAFPLDLNGSTGYVFDAYLGLAEIPKYKPRQWFDYRGAAEIPWETKEITIDAFPGVTFTWSGEGVKADGKTLFGGVGAYALNIYLADLTNDGKPELCATVSFGSGIVSNEIIVYDFAAKRQYRLADRMRYDYYLSIQDGKLVATQVDYADGRPLGDYSDGSMLASSELRLVNGEIYRFGHAAE
jgi:hypothetical protein